MFCLRCLRGLSCLCNTQLSLDFSDSLAKPALDFRDSLTFAHVSSLIKVLKVGAQFLQQLVGKPRGHSSLILHQAECAHKVTRRRGPVIFPDNPARHCPIASPTLHRACSGQNSPRYLRCVFIAPA